MKTQTLKKTFVIVTVSDRVADLNILLESIICRPKFNDYDINILMQDYADKKDGIIQTERITNLFIVPERLGCNAARIMLLNKLNYDVYINLDDDMEFTDYTDFNRVIKKVCEKETGFIIINWARNEKLLMQKVPKMRDVFVKQTMIYQGGGMVYSSKIAEIIKLLPQVPSVFDESWCLTAYLNGYTNYRYLGALSVHKICTRGGMNAFFKETDYAELELTNAKYIDYVLGKNGRWCIPMDAQLNSLARETHEKNKEKRRFK